MNDQQRGRGRARRGRPPGSTRERILDVALSMFNEQGYDKTSLREIADALGFTKAALYYHFEHKEDILLALHMRLHALGKDLLDRLTALDEQADVDTWLSMIEHYIDQVMANRDLFLMHARNQSALQQISHHDANASEHQDMEQQLRRFFADERLSLPTRVRMACSLGAVTAPLMGFADAFGDVDPNELAQEIVVAIRSMFEATGTGAARAAAGRPGAGRGRARMAPPRGRP